MDSSTLISIAKEAIVSKLNNDEFRYSKYENIPFLHEQKACFVTLTKNDNLRGCIGSLQAHRPFLQDLIQNARAAAFSDPRFTPLTHQELDEIEIEVSVLTHPQELVYSDYEDLKQKIIPFTHGVILKHTYHQATFLPSVWEQLPTFDDFFANLCAKAQMSSNCLESHPQIYTYEAIKYR